jgi:hypothetical protein
VVALLAAERVVGDCAKGPSKVVYSLTQPRQRRGGNEREASLGSKVRCVYPSRGGTGEGRVSDEQGDLRMGRWAQGGWEGAKGEADAWHNPRAPAITYTIPLRRTQTADAKRESLAPTAPCFHERAIESILSIESEVRIRSDSRANRE